MKLPNPKFTRRTFLWGAGTTVAVIAVDATACSLLGASPLEVAVLLDGENPIRSLRAVLRLSELVPQSITSSSRSLQDKVRRLSGGHIPTLSLRLLADGNSSLARRPDALLIFGPWRKFDDVLLAVLRHRLPVYLDDPTLALRLSTSIPARLLDDRSLVGLLSPFDPALSFAVERIRSGLMGEISDVAVMSRCRDPIVALEAAAALDQLCTNRAHILVRRIATRNASSSIDIRCERGQLQIPIHTLQDRNQLLFFRLAHFAAVARGEVEPAICLGEMPKLSTWLE